MAQILIIDDDLMIRRLVVRTLMSAGHLVVEATDGEEGLELFRSYRPAVVITDILMPGLEGISTIRELRRAFSDIVIIAISGGGQTFDMNYLDFARKLGADAVLPKPFRPAELIALVRSLLPG